MATKEAVESEALRKMVAQFRESEAENTSCADCKLKGIWNVFCSFIHLNMFKIPAGRLQIWESLFVFDVQAFIDLWGHTSLKFAQSIWISGLRNK